MGKLFSLLTRIIRKFEDILISAVAAAIISNTASLRTKANMVKKKMKIIKILKNRDFFFADIVESLN